ncbi:MAG: TetR family transcriptional regulator [Acidimicrobiales bacterium]
MPNSRTPSPPGDRADDHSQRQALLDAALGSLVEDGFAATSARSIATRVGCAQGLVFYHYGTVTNLLLAALDAACGQRLETYRQLVDECGAVEALLAGAGPEIEHDLRSGVLAALAQLVAGAAANPGLADELDARLAPWRQLLIEVARAQAPGYLRALVSPEALARSLLALLLGLGLLGQLDGQVRGAAGVFANSRPLGQLLGRLTGVPR